MKSANWKNRWSYTRAKGMLPMLLEQIDSEDGSIKYVTNQALNVTQQFMKHSNLLLQTEGFIKLKQGLRH